MCSLLSAVQEPEQDTCTAVMPLLIIMDPLNIQYPLQGFLLIMHYHIYRLHFSVQSLMNMFIMLGTSEQL
jgi:hypothetical protein